VTAWRDLIAEEAQRDRAKWAWPAEGGQSNFRPGIGLTNAVTGLINEFIAKRRLHYYGKHCVTNAALPIGIAKGQNAGIPLAQPADVMIAIGAIEYNPASGNQEEEYVQLRNTNGFAVDVSGWKLGGGISFTLKPGTVIPAGASLYLSPNVNAFRARASSPHGGQGLYVQGNYSGQLNAWGESVTLTDDTGRLVATNLYAGNPSSAQRYLRLTEIMYNPAPMAGNTNDAQQFEYVELKNTSLNATLDLSGVRFTNGIHFAFSGSGVTQLAPGQMVLVVRNAAAFAARYGSALNVAGEYAGILDNAGETLRLEDAVGEKILEFAYDNHWYPITDGLGFSLVIVDENAPWDSWGKKASWRASSVVNGSPGAADPALDPDSDGDGLPDAWEIANGTNPWIPDANADPDHDGLDNLREYWAGTSPTNAASALRIESALTMPDGAQVLSFTAVSNRSYTVLFRNDQLFGAWEKLTDVLSAPTMGPAWITNRAGINSGRFYRLVTPKQN